VHAWGQRREPVAAAQGPHRHLPAWARKEQLQGVRSARDPSSSSVLPTAKEPPGPPAAIAMLRSIPALPPPSLDTATEPGRQLVDSTTWSLRPPRWPMILGAVPALRRRPQCLQTVGRYVAIVQLQSVGPARIALSWPRYWTYGGQSEGGREGGGERERERGREGGRERDAPSGAQHATHTIILCTCFHRHTHLLLPASCRCANALCNLYYRCIFRVYYCSPLTW